MLRYSDVKTYLTDGLTAKGYGAADKPMPTFDPGPPTIEGLWTKSPNALVFLTVGNGMGLVHEGLYDQPFVVVRTIGLQQNYDYAETLAYDIDAVFNAVETVNVGTTRTLYMTRNAPPQLVDYDSASRYHFQATYITEALR